MTSPFRPSLILVILLIVNQSILASDKCSSCILVSFAQDDTYLEEILKFYHNFGLNGSS